jgi:hypothetical protein
MPLSLQSKLDAVYDEETFVAFVSALAADRHRAVAKQEAHPSSPGGPGARGWESATIETFLTAAATWATESKNGLRFYRKPENPWKRCADLIYMGKIYK